MPINTNAIGSKISLTLDTDFNTGVTFKIRPEITEIGTQNYSDNPFPGLPAGIVIATGTSNRTFNISAKFLSRTVEEANETYLDISFLSSLRLPNPIDGDKKPPIVLLSGYGSQFQFIPMVMSSITKSWDDDSDYIVASNAHVPIVQKVDMLFIESHTTDQLKAFNSASLQSYRQGVLSFY